MKEQKPEKEIKLDLPLSHWMKMCENNIFQFAKEQMLNSGIPVDLHLSVMEAVMSRVKSGVIDCLINSNVELIANNKKEVVEDGNDN